MTDQLVLVANAGDGTISAFRFDAAAPSLERVSTSTVGEGCSTFAIDRERNLVYASAKGDEQGVDVFRLERSSGRLERVGHLDTDDSLTYLTLARGGTLLAAASYGGGYAAVFPVDGEGGVAEPVARVEWPNAHCVAVAEDGRHLYVVSLGADVVAQYEMSEHGELTPLEPATAEAPEGSGPRHLIFSGDEQNAYVSTEFSGQALIYGRDAATGTLTRRGAREFFAPDRGLSHSRIGADPVEEHLIWGADLHLARDERYLLASERCESTVASLPVAQDGSASAMVALHDTVKQPRGFAVSPEGSHAVVSGEKSTEVELITVGEDGSVTSVGRYETGEGANWVRFLG